MSACAVCGRPLPDSQARRFGATCPECVLTFAAAEVWPEVPGLDVLGIQPGKLAQRVQRFVAPALLFQIRMERLVCSSRLVASSQRFERPAQHVQNLDRFLRRPQRGFQRLSKCGHSVFMPSPGFVAQAYLRIGFERVGAAGRGLFEFLNRLFEEPGFSQHQTTFIALSRGVLLPQALRLRCRPSRLFIRGNLEPFFL